MLSKYSLFLFPLFLTACGPAAVSADADSQPQTGDMATEESASTRNGEWTELMPDGNLDAWHSYGQDEVGDAWKVDEDGAIYLDTSNKGEHGVVGGGDLTTDETYSNYELELEWKIGDCGNSGIIYNVNEEGEQGASYMTGPEMQIVDNACHPDAKIVKHRAGDLYDLQTGEPENVKPAGEWNSVRLVVTDGRVEQWQNGERVVSYANNGPEWDAMIADSKFKDWGSFGSYTSGKIALQDHGDPVWFRNVRIRELSGK
ncbi:DUF1080 domain-containing protein [Lewinella sp. IMCC34183]|uniref:3-keto-disaccharide hydrolase n=1 Tax=Lewinella sp. IMCC34183 TaxID=2248762 RepID=UPI000E27F95E|nr:DUF1080 domain-containing protein [Lewinella sp. IMCC34183]